MKKVFLTFVFSAAILIASNIVYADNNQTAPLTSIPAIAQLTQQADNNTEVPVTNNSSTITNISQQADAKSQEKKPVVVSIPIVSGGNGN